MNKSWTGRIADDCRNHNYLYKFNYCITHEVHDSDYEANNFLSDFTYFFSYMVAYAQFTNQIQMILEMTWHFTNQDRYNEYMGRNQLYV